MAYSSYSQRRKCGFFTAASAHIGETGRDNRRGNDRGVTTSDVWRMASGGYSTTLSLYRRIDNVLQRAALTVIHAFDVGGFDGWRGVGDKPRLSTGISGGVDKTSKLVRRPSFAYGRRLPNGVVFRRAYRRHDTTICVSRRKRGGAVCDMSVAGASEPQAVCAWWRVAYREGRRLLGDSDAGANPYPAGGRRRRIRDSSHFVIYRDMST